MRRDAKLGLALGMLVVGFATAFCFPRQEASVAWLKHAEPTPIADSELDFLPIRAYQSAPAEAAPSLSSTVPEPNSAAAVDPPPPIRTADEPPSLEIPLLPPVEIASDAHAPLAAPTAGDPSKSSSPGAGERSYVIRAGDTLSGISIRFFGTSQRFQRIYERNRDRLKNENDLKVGTEIIIPATAEAGSRPVESAPGLSEADVTPIPQVEGTGPSSAPGARFERAADAPFLNERTRLR